MLLEKRIPFRYLLDKVKADMFRVLVFSVLVVILKNNFLEYLPEVHIALPSILGTSISLLLAFKLNQSYDRWWEARKVWGGIVNDSRMLVNEVLSFVADEDLEKEEIKIIVRRMASRQIAWAYSLGQALRRLDALKDMDQYLEPAEIAEAARHDNVPAALLAAQSRDIKCLYRSGVINAYQQVQLDTTLSRFFDHAGKTERIKNTVFPRTYRMFIHLFIYLFLAVLSLALVETIGYYEIPFLLVIAVTLFLVEKTATKLQDPFENRETDIPVTSIAATIEKNIRNLMNEFDVKTRTEREPATFYIM